MKIEVTQSDIDSGLSGDCLNCPIALAVKRLGFVGVSVGEDTIICNRVRAALPGDAQTFIKRFDDNDDVEPFSFELDLS